MLITKKNHYNPCLWTAYWNFNYYHNEDLKNSQKARNQQIYSLNLIGNKILTTTVEKVFYEKGMGIANITYNSVLDFTKRNQPHDFNDIQNTPKKYFNDLIMDFENFFTILDELIQNPLKSIIHKNEINTIEDKIHIASFIVDLKLRNYKNFNNLVYLNSQQKKPKFELFWNLKKDFSDPEYLMKMIIPIVASEWILYRSNKFSFPLGDDPILINRKNILFALSPKMLLKINFRKKVPPENICIIKDNINFLNYKDFMGRTVQNSYREIIFSDKAVLEKLKNSRVYKNKINELKRILTKAHSACHN